VPDFSKKSPNQTIRRPSSARDAISAVKLSEGLTADVDAWAEAHDMVRSDAIRHLVELGLSASTISDSQRSTDPLEIENLAVKQIDHLLDPSLPTEERERRIRRLTEGPPEFSDERIDLPTPRK
jgi:lipase chaperone LimK